MKLTFKLILLLLGLSVMTFIGCNKRHGRAVVIKCTSLNSPKPETLTGTFTITGAINTAGDGFMVVEPRGTDSIHCSYTMTAAEGTIILAMDCEAPPAMSGAWKVVGGNGAYFGLHGNGPLTMMFPPDVPAGVLNEETMTGEVWWR